MTKKDEVIPAHAAWIAKFNAYNEAHRKISEAIMPTRSMRFRLALYNIREYLGGIGTFILIITAVWAPILFLASIFFNN